PDDVMGSDPSDADLVERVVASRVLHRGHYLEFRVDTIERADGTRSERDIAGHPGAVAIVAIDPDGQILLVRQWRTPAVRILLERRSLADALAAVDRGEIADAKSIVGLLWVARRQLTG